MDYRHILTLAATLDLSSGPYPRQDGTGNMAAGSNDPLLVELNASIVAKMFPDNYMIVPYALAGVGASAYGGYYGAFIPLGVGIQARFSEGLFGLINAQYRVPVTETVNYHFYYSFGIAASLVPPKPKIIPPPPVPIVLDRDGDGVVDSIDACPDVPGLARYKGCPIPDTDGDGINDEQDKCPTVRGLARYQGCPIPDTDGDGVNDEEDKCPTVPGPKENHGCPVNEEVIKKVNYDAQHIFFQFNKAVLLQKSFTALDEVAGFMKQDPSLKLDIEGHTDNSGNAAYNQTLSEKRAKAVINYLSQKGGIDASRMTATGYGSTKPLTDNKSKNGRAQNRRVEMKLKY